MKRNFRKTLLYVLILLVVLTTILQFIHLGATPFTPVEGALDLSAVDLSQELVQISAAEWAYYPGQLYTPQDFFDSETIPPVYGDNAATEEFGTYRLVLQLPSNKIYGITGQGFNFCQRTYINGALIEEIGSPGASLEETIPRTRTYDYYFTPENGRAELIFHVSNFVHRDGGRNRAIILSEPGLIMRYRGIEMIKTSLVVGCLITVFLYFLGMYIFFHQRPQFLYLALAAFCTALRTLMVGEKHIMLLFPDLNWFFAIRAEYILNILFVVFLTLYFAALYPDAIHRYFLYGIVGFSGAYILVVLFTSTKFFTSMLLWHTAIWVAASVYTLFCLLRQLRKHDLFTTLIVIGLALFVFTAFFDEISYQFFLGVRIHNTLITGVLLCIFMNMVALTLEFSINERELADSRVAIMLSQIQPHFLYNSLVAIYQLCDVNPQDAKETILDFSDYLRGNLDSLTRREPVPFETELEHVKHYVSIEKRRFEDRVHFDFRIECSDFLLPALSLQPIVENAIRHGIMPKRGGGTVTIATAETEKDYVVTVTDDGVGFSPGTQKDDSRTHVGLENVKGRLESMCQGKLELHSTADVGTTVTITLPKTHNSIHVSVT